MKTKKIEIAADDSGGVLGRFRRMIARHISTWIGWGCRCLAAGILAMTSLQAREFRAAVVKVDITPDKPMMLRGYNPRMSTGVHDKIYHRIVALDDGLSAFFLIASDLCSLSPAFCDRVTGNLARDLGVPPQNVWWAITHNHSSPYVGPPGIPGVLRPNRHEFPVDESYTALIEKTLVDGVKEARGKMAPARFGTGWGYADANINRRPPDGADGGMNPQGTVDRRIGLLRLEHANGAPLALIANYAMHATVLGRQNTLVTGDAPGFVSEYVEQKTGMPMLYINGAAGNLAPLYSVGPDFRFLNQFKFLLGDPILEANRKLRLMHRDIELHTEIITVETPKKASVPWSDELRDYLKISPAGEQTLLVRVRFLRLNEDTLVWSAPMELFCDISNAIRDRSPFPNTFYFGYTNGTFAYMPTEKEYMAGGYEPSMTPFTASAGADLQRAVLNQIHALKRK